MINPLRDKKSKFMDKDKSRVGEVKFFLVFQVFREVHKAQNHDPKGRKRVFEGIGPKIKLRPRGQEFKVTEIVKHFIEKYSFLGYPGL